jgi:hypothetical protein
MTYDLCMYAMNPYAVMLMYPYALNLMTSL